MKKYIYITFATLLLLSSCTDFLTKEPVLSQTNELTLSSFKGLDAATAAAYGSLYSVNWYGCDLMVTSDLRGGNAKRSPKNSGRYTTAYQWDYNKTISAPLWSTAYNCISRANNVINVIEGGFTETGISEQRLKNIKAEVLFLRALSHFDLVRLYAQPYTYDKTSLGVPVILKTENGKPTRNTVEDVFMQVVADLTEAEKIIADNYVRAGVTDKFAVVTKPTIQALLSRVYLYMGEWQKSADYATLLINNPKFKMWTKEEFTTYDKKGVWGQNQAKDGGEIIFEVYGSEGNSNHGNWDNITYLVNANAGYADVGASNDLISLYESDDVRGKLFESSPDFPSSFWTTKYPGKNGNLREDNIVVLRLSEMYLNRAEAIFNGASIAGVTAASDLNTITSNRGASPVTVDAVTLFNERRKELSFEGHITFDYARTKRSLVRVDYDGTANQNVPFPSYKWALPIPQREMDANENMVQNPEYN